jgi:hypothetical protein
LGGFIGSTGNENHYAKTARDDGRKPTRKKTQTGEEGRRVFSESFEENPREEDPIPDRQFCIRSISTVALDHKERKGGKVQRIYGAAQTPLARVLASAQVAAATKERLVQDKARLNPFALKQVVTRSMKVISAMRRHHN